MPTDCGCRIEYSPNKPYATLGEPHIEHCPEHLAAPEIARQRDDLLKIASAALGWLWLWGKTSREPASALILLEKLKETIQQAKATNAPSRTCDRCGVVSPDVTPPGFHGDESGLYLGCEAHVEGLVEAPDAGATEVTNG